jgi:CRP/FNR family transcriptional regulator, nitrogen fixation regulation protein
MLTQTMTNRAASQRPASHDRRAISPVASHSLSGQVELMGATMPFSRNAEIYGENEKAEYLYKVISGSVRTYKVLNDGRRQIGAFYLPGDLFGLEIGNDHTFSAEAITDSKVLVIKRSGLVALAAHDNDVAPGHRRLSRPDD